MKKAAANGADTTNAVCICWQSMKYLITRKLEQQILLVLDKSELDSIKREMKFLHKHAEYEDQQMLWEKLKEKSILMEKNKAGEKIYLLAMFSKDDTNIKALNNPPTNALSKIQFMYNYSTLHV